jgi:glyceraldehyde 3-phosphate dehydrogenase
MSVQVGINGYGRIGRLLHRILLQRAQETPIAVTSINDPSADSATFTFLLEHDSVYGLLPQHVEATEKSISVDRQPVSFHGCTDPGEIPWGDSGIEIVVESSGRFTTRDKAAMHLAGGVHHVVISAPSPDADMTVCLGVNDGLLDPSRHHVIANASCTTNCLAPMVRALDESVGIEQGYLTTVHGYTTGQNLLDLARVGRSGKADLRRMRAAPLSIVPTSTGATRALAQVLPKMEGRLDGLALRVPVPDGSIVDLVVTTSEPVEGPDQINAVFAEAASDRSYRGVLEYSEAPLVSADIVGNPASCVFSARDTMARGQMVKVLGWYDNEWAYACRLADLLELLAGGSLEQRGRAPGRGRAFAHG